MRKSLEFLVNSKSDNLVFLTLIGLEKFFAFEDETSEKHLRQALAINNEFSPTLVALGELERFTLRGEEARETYKQVLREDA